MNRSWPYFALGVLCYLLLPSWANCQPMALAVAAPTIETSKLAEDAAAYFSDDSSLPVGMLSLMRASQLNYLEGSILIKAGESEKAREAFNKAVDLLLQSDWDLKSTPALDRFFQDLIHRIQEDESRYLLAPREAEETTEGAVVDELDKVDLIPISVDPSLQDAVVADLDQTKYDIPVTINEMVLKSLNYWLSRGRKFFVDGLVRSGQYRSMIEGVFREESVPLDLMYMAQVESLFRPHAVSRAQAKGIWQFERGTAVRYGLKVNRYVDERSDPEKSTRAAAHYLNDLFAMFKDWNLVLAAYNWGEGKVQRLIEHSGLNDFWQLVDLRRKLPDETKNHIPMVMASVILARNPEKYGLPTDLDPPLKYAQITVSKPIDLRAAARLLSTTLDQLKKLNPALRGLSTPASYPDFRLKVPIEADPSAYQKVADLPPVKFKPAPEYASQYKVQRGDTLGKIAARYHVSVAELEKANGGLSSKTLRTGRLIHVPSRAAAVKKVPASSRIASSGRKRSSKIAAGKHVAKGSKTASSKSAGSKQAAFTKGRAPVRRSS